MSTDIVPIEPETIPILSLRFATDARARSRIWISLHHERGSPGRVEPGMPHRNASPISVTIVRISVAAPTTAPMIIGTTAPRTPARRACWPKNSAATHGARRTAVATTPTTTETQSGSSPPLEYPNADSVTTPAANDRKAKTGISTIAVQARPNDGLDGDDVRGWIALVWQRSQPTSSLSTSIEPGRRPH